MTEEMKKIAEAIKAERDHWTKWAENGKDERYYGAMGALENLAGRIADATDWKLIAHRAEFYSLCGF